MRTTLAAALGFALAAGLANAQEAPESEFTSDQVRDFFAEETATTRSICPEGTTCLPKPADLRMVCLGAAQNCGEEEATPVTSGFNLLITFEYNSFSLTPQAQANLNEFAKALQEDGLSAATFTIEGHTDASGSADYNDSLSLRRAEAVVAYLAERGVAVDRLKPVGYGERALYKPEDPNAAINRRVEAALIIE